MSSDVQMLAFWFVPFLPCNVPLFYSTYYTRFHDDNMKGFSTLTSVCSFQETTLSTQPFSSRRTSSRNRSTSFQQSSGRRSFSRRHRTTSLRASSTDSGTSLTSRLLSRRSLSSCISLLTTWRDVGVCSGAVSAASFSVSCARRASSSAFRRRSSVATRACIWASVCCARVASVCLTGTRVDRRAGLVLIGLVGCGEEWTMHVPRS